MAEILYTDFDHLTEGERNTANTLRDLPAKWTVICNKVLPRQGKLSREIDFVVIGENTVLAIDEKSWTGDIQGNDVIWKRANGDSERSPLNKVDMVAKELAGYIRRRALRTSGIDREFVYGCVSLTRQNKQPQIKDPRSPKFVLLYQDLIDLIRDLDAHLGHPNVGIVSGEIRTALFDFRDRPRRPNVVNEYRILEGYDGIIGGQVCRAIHREGMERFLTIFASGPEDEENRDFFLQEFRVLEQLGELGVSPRVFDPFRYSDDFLVVPSSIPRGTSLGSLPEPENETEMMLDLRRLQAVFHSLATVHEKGIIHRMISPDKIYIEETGDNIKAVLTGFYAARRPNNEEFSIGNRLNQLGIVDPLAAPELVVGYEWADQTSDTYSASLMLLERISRVPAERLTETNRPLEASLSAPTWGLMRDDVVNSLKIFFQDTLGEDPPREPGGHVSGRLSAAECSQRLSQIILMWS